MCPTDVGHIFFVSIKLVTTEFVIVGKICLKNRI